MTMKSKMRIALLAVPALAGIMALTCFNEYSVAAPPALSSAASEEEIKRDKVILETMLKVIRQEHFDPTTIDDEFSHEAFDMWIERNDYNKKIFLQSDYDELKSHYYDSIDDHLKSQNFGMFNQSFEILNRRIHEDSVIVNEILTQPFDFSVKESVELDPEKISYSKNDAERREAWRKYLKYMTMVRFVEIQKANKKDIENKKAGVALKTDTEIETEAREKVKKVENDIFQRLSKVDRSDRMAIYLNVVTGVYDPHTSFYPPADKENFDINMSGQLQGIGATLQEKDGFTVVTSIVPGSPSWKNGKLAKDDKILKVAQGDEGEFVDVVGKKLDDVIKLIRGKKGTIVRLYIEKPDGSQMEIKLVRDIIILEETYAQSAVIEQGKNKVGYILLPSFYADFTPGKTSGRACAEDIRKELEKLKAEKVSGIILDLRDNGGGSLIEVIKMVGLFIPQGPVVQVKLRSGEVKPYDDQDGGSVTYDGPLVVMINENSASASEIFAAAIQDYKRGAIVGTYSRSFGKGTVQNFYDLDNSMVRGSSDMKPLGSVKVTIQKFYRVNGGSTQLKGVTPDIQLPGYYSLIEYGEQDLDYPMEWDKVPVMNYKVWKDSVNVSKLSKSSAARVAQSTAFGLVKTKSEQLKRERDITTESLLLSDYLAAQQKLEEENKQFKPLEDPVKGLNAVILKDDKTKMAGDSAKIARKEVFLKNLNKDVWVNECASIAKDLK